MISGVVDGPDDYYGLTNLKKVQYQKPRKMKRTQLSNEKKSNHSQKSFSNQRDSHFSNLKSKRSVNNNNSALKNQQNSSYKNSLLGTNDNNLPSCTQIHSINNSSTRKSRLQINTGVVGIKMQNFSPNTFLSHPSKVLFVNESTSGKKGSKSKKQKSILYVEYNNFMAEVNNNKNQNRANSSSKKYQENHIKNPQQCSHNKKQANSKKNIKKQDIDNEYFIGMKRQCLSPVNNDKQKNQNKQKNIPQGQKIIETQNNKKSRFLQSPKIHQSSLANLSLSSAMGDKLQSPKLFTNSPKMLKTEPIEFYQKQQLKSKINMQDNETLKDKNKILQSNDSKLKYQPKTQQKRQNEKNNQIKRAKVNFLQNFNLNNSKQKLKQKQILSSQQSQKPIIVSSQNQLQDFNDPPLKKYNTQKEIYRQKNQPKIISQKIIQSTQNLANPYNLRKDQNLVTSYHKKKIFGPLKNSSKQNIKNSQGPISKDFFSDKKAKQSILKTQQNQNFSAVSESAISQNSSKNGRRLMKIDVLGSKSKILLSKSQQKKIIVENEIIPIKNINDQQKSPQSGQNYYRPRISVHQLLKNNQNQSKISDVNSDSQSSKIKKNSFKLSRSRQIESKQKSQIKRFQDYKTDYYTPNPHSIKNFQSASRISKKDNESQIGSELDSNASDFKKFDKESQASQVSDINDQQSLKTDKNKFLSSSSRLKRQQILRKSNLRSSRNSQKSINSNISKKLSLNPKKSSQYQIIIQEPRKINEGSSDKNLRKSPTKQESHSKISSSQSNQSLIQGSLNQPSIVKFMNKKEESQSHSVKSEMKNNSTVPKKSSLHPTQYKKELMVQNIQSQIQPYQLSKINDEKNQNELKNNKGSNIGLRNDTLNKSMDKSQNQNTSNLRPPHAEYKDLSGSNHSSKLISSMKRSGLRKSIKNSIHHSGVNLPSTMLTSKHPKSNLLAKSGKDFKPLTVSNPKIQDFLTYIDEYEITIGFLYLYVENTLLFYCMEDDERVAPQTERFLNKIKNQKMQKYEEKYQRLSFLVLKKYFYQKNRLIKCLRGLQSNVFKLSDLQIPDEILKKFLPHQQTKQKLKQIQLETKQLFKQLDEKFRALRSKGNNKRDKLIKIQAPYDNFSRDIVQNLVEELNQLTAQIDELEIDTASSNPSIPLKRSNHYQSLTSVIAQQIFTSQERGVEIMQLVFLISELQSRKTKKVELLNISDIDFQVYYEKYIDKLLQTYQFFESIKYPSDEVEKKTSK